MSLGLEIWYNVAVSIGGVGALLAGIAAIRNLPRIAKSYAGKLKDETLFGEEARMRHEELEKTLSTEADSTWGPSAWEGGGNFTYMLEIKHFEYSPKDDGIEWKGVKKSVRYVYSENGKLKVKGWRIKK
jgi:hypothetical protein